MKWTNDLELPLPIVNAVVNDPYTKGDSDISITTLVAPPRIRVLRKLHEQDITEDVADRMWVLLGQVMHGILDRASGGSSGIHEQRFYADIEGIKVSGQLDAFYVDQDGLVQDYKLVSLWSVKDGVKPEYEQQLNCYAALLRINGYVVNKLELVCILRDWTVNKARVDEDVPQQQVIKLSVNVWSQDEALKFLTERVLIHKRANKFLPTCTADDRWAEPDKFAVMTEEGAPRSLRNHMSFEDAEEHVKKVLNKHPKAFVELRPGSNKRCESYCNVAPFCKQYQKLRGN